MKTLKFKRDFDARPTPTLMRAYKKGSTYSGVTEADANAALAAGAAELVPDTPTASTEEATESPRRGRK